MEVVSYIAITQAIFAIILLSTKRPVRLQDKILIILLADIAWIILGSIVRSATSGHTIFAKFSLIPFNLTLLPLLYLYVQNSISENPRFILKDLLHFIFPGAFFIFSIFYKPTYEIDVQFYFNPKFTLPIIIQSTISVIYISLYIVLISKLIRNHQKNILNHFSFRSSRITFNWIKIVILLFMLTWAQLVFSMTLNLIYDTRAINAGLVLFINLALFSFAISYFGFIQPAIFFSDKESTLLPSARGKNQVKPKVKYEKSSLTEMDAKENLDKLIELLENERLYLQPDLSIQDLSDKLEVQKHLLTESLNIYLGKNFYTLINEYRIAAFKKMIEEKMHEEFTLLALAYEAGFNSKSSFNMVFKKQTGQTPSQYLDAVT
jgi:AraC-like DNA-binding protein